MKANKLFAGGLAGVLLASAFAANATILTVFDGITDGVADFDSTVTGAGGTVIDIHTAEGRFNFSYESNGLF